MNRFSYQIVKIIQKSIIIIQSFYMLFKISLGKEIHIMKNKEAITLAQLKRFIQNIFKKLPDRYTLAYTDAEGDQIALSTEADISILHQSGFSKVKIEIEETSQQFYDQRQEVCFEDQLSNFESQIVEEKEEKFQIKLQKSKPDLIDLNQSQLLNIQNLDQSIQEKMRIMMPDMIKQIKEQLLEQSRLNEAQIPSQSLIIEEKVKHPDYVCKECRQNPIQGVRYQCAICQNFNLCQSCQAKISHNHPLLKIKRPSQAIYKIKVTLQKQKDKVSQFFKKLLNQCSQKMEEKKQQTELKIKTEIKSQQFSLVQQNNQGPLIKEKVVEKKQESTINKENLQEKGVSKINSRTEQEQLREKANYLCEILSIHPSASINNYVKKNKNLTKQEILQLYFVELPF